MSTPRLFFYMGFPPGCDFSGGSSKELKNTAQLPTTFRQPQKNFVDILSKNLFLESQSYEHFDDYFFRVYPARTKSSVKRILPCNCWFLRWVIAELRRPDSPKLRHGSHLSVMFWTFFSKFSLFPKILASNCLFLFI